MALLYPSGYGTSYKLRTKEEHTTYLNRLGVHPEVVRRASAMCDHCTAAGHGLGGGGGKRDSFAQRDGFLSVHYRVASAALSDGCYYDGSWWAQKPNTIHKAPMGDSYHEGCPTPSDWAYALDMVGDTKFMQGVAAQFGLRVFGSIDYPHVQPYEFSPSRVTFNANPSHYLPIKTWIIQGQEPEMQPLIPPYRNDTRVDGSPLAAGEVRRFAVMYGGTAVMANLTVIPLNQSAGFLTAFSDAQASPPNSSNVNWDQGRITANLALIPTNGGWIKVRATQACHLVIDTQGYSV